MHGVSDVTIRKVDRLVLFSIIRSWTSGFLLAGGIGMLAIDFVLYTVDIRFAPLLYGSVALAYVFLAASIGGFKASLPLTISVTAGLVVFSALGIDLLHSAD